MKIDIRFHGLDHSNAFSEYATRRIEHVLGRLGRKVTRVMLRVVDTNGPRGGDDKRCRLVISGPGLGTVILTEVRGDVYSATEMALYRALRQGLGRSRGRGGESARGAPRSTQVAPNAGPSLP
jgi:putative sigma-54 modulation protein